MEPLKRDFLAGVTTSEVAAMIVGYLARQRLAKEGWPYVCPGCHAVAPDRCVPGCIDAEIEEDHRRAIESGDYDIFNDEEDE